MGDYYDNEITPYTDTDMVWNEDRHRYILTIAAVDNEYNVSFVAFAGNIENAESLLREISADMYKYVYRYNRRAEKKRRAVEHLLAKNGDLREVIRDAMLDMVRALIRGGYTLQKDLSWVNPERGTVLDLSNIPSIAPDAQELLLSSGILHKGEYTYSINDDDYRADY